MTRDEAMIHTLLKENDNLKSEIKRLMFENEELRENIEKAKAEINDQWMHTCNTFPGYADGMVCAYQIIDRHTKRNEEE